MLLIALIAAAMIGPATPANKGCTPVQTRALVVRFVNAFNRGDARTLNLVWDSKQWFQWFGVTSEPGRRVDDASKRRDTLLPYFATRHAVNERLQLTSFTIKAYSRGYRDFYFELRRSADDLADGPVAYSGKGASSCVTGRLDVWVMGTG